MENVIVTAFIHLPDHYQKLDFYMKYGEKLLNMNYRKIIFIETEMYDTFKSFESTLNKFILIKKENMYLYKYLDFLNEKTEGNQQKDNNLFYTIMCNKTEFVKEAIESDIFEADNFIWVDFGIFKILNEPVLFENLNKQYHKIRIGTIWNLDSPCCINLHTQIAWYFAGGIFGGDKESLLKFSKLMKKEVLEFIKNNNHLLWEVNLWYFVYQNNKDLFQPYLCDHNNSIINNY